MSARYDFTPAELCKLLDLRKSTLLRWEREGRLQRRVGRDLSGSGLRRKYTKDDVLAVIRIQIDQLVEKEKQAIKDGDVETRRRIQEAISVSKFIGGNIWGLRELAESDQLPPKTIKLLLQVALDQYEPDDEVFCEIMRVVRIQCCTKFDAEVAESGETAIENQRQPDTLAHR